MVVIFNDRKSLYYHNSRNFRLMTGKHFSYHLLPFRIHMHFLLFHKIATDDHFGNQKITFDHIDGQFKKLEFFSQHGRQQPVWMFTNFDRIFVIIQINMQICHHIFTKCSPSATVSNMNFIWALVCGGDGVRRRDQKQNIIEIFKFGGYRYPEGPDRTFIWWLVEAIVLSYNYCRTIAYHVPQDNDIPES